MMTSTRVERVLKDLGELVEVAEMGFVGCNGPLEERVELSRLKNEIREARTIIRRNLYRLEDAEKYANNAVRCGGCQTIVEKPNPE